MYDCHVRHEWFFFSSTDAEKCEMVGRTEPAHEALGFLDYQEIPFVDEIGCHDTPLLLKVRSVRPETNFILAFVN